MPLNALRSQLKTTFYAPAAQGFDAVFQFTIGGDRLVFEVANGRLVFDEKMARVPDATFFFADEDLARALLAGRADAFSAFMEGRFRADGYLMWAFALLAMFPGASPPGNAAG